MVREALKVLAAKGLVQSRQRRGTVVLPRESWNLLDGDILRWQGRLPPDFGFLERLAEVRAMVEPPAARFAAQRRTSQDLDTMRAALDDMAAALQDPDIMVDADLRFHRALLDAAHNEVLSRMEVILATGLQIRDRFVHHSEQGADPIARSPRPLHRDTRQGRRQGRPDGGSAARPGRQGLGRGPGARRTAQDASGPRHLPRHGHPGNTRGGRPSRRRRPDLPSRFLTETALNEHLGRCLNDGGLPLDVRIAGVPIGPGRPEA